MRDYFRTQLWEVIATVRDGADRVPTDADTDDIIDGIIDSGWLDRVLAAERERIAQAIERRNDTGLNLDSLPEWDDSCMSPDEAWAHGLADAIRVARTEDPS